MDVAHTATEKSSPLRSGHSY